VAEMVAAKEPDLRQAGCGITIWESARAMGPSSGQNRCGELTIANLEDGTEI